MKYLINIIILLTVFNTFASNKDIVAIVNDRPITMYEFNARKKLITTLSKIQDLDAAAEHRLNKDVLNILIDEELLLQHTEKVGGTISKENIDAAISEIEQRNKMPKGHLLQYLREFGLSVESFRKQIRGELIKSNIINSLSNSFSISPKELDVAVINSGFEDFDIEAWVFTSFNNDDKTLQAMEKLKKKLSNCSKVDEKYYDDFAHGEKFDRKLKNLEDKTKSVVLDTAENKSSSIYQEDGKFKLILVCEKKSSVSGEDFNKIKHFLYNQKMSKKATKFFKDLKSKAYIKILMNF